MARITMTLPPAVPPAIPNYRLLRLIGSGSFGEVWLALDVFHRWVAVKVVRWTSDGAARIHDQEFRGLRRYVTVAGTDRSLVPISNVGEDPDGYFFHYAMELADDAGTELPLPAIDPDDSEAEEALATGYRPLTLREKLRAGRLPPDECIRYGVALAEALEHLHEHGLVHRDVKPSNIIIVSGRAKLADVGLVANPDGTVVSLAGTPDFVPLHGAGRPTGDVFALGKVLYLMANGRPLTDFPELIEGHEKLPASDREALAELAAVYDRACDPDPSQRHASASELRAELESLKLAGSVLQLRHQRQEAQKREVEAVAAIREAERRAAEFAQRLRFVGILGLVSLLVVLVVLFRGWRLESAHRVLLAAMENRQLARMNHRLQGWSADDWQEIRLASDGQPDEVMLRQAAATLSGLDARSIGHWMNVLGTSAAFSKTDDLVVSGYGTNRASLIFQGTNRIELPVSGEGKVAWGRDGEPLVFQIEPGRGVLREARSGRVRREFLLGVGDVGHQSHAPVTALSFDGSKAAAVLEGQQSRRLALWDTDSGRLLAETNFTANVLAFSPDQSRLAAGHTNGSVTIFRLLPFVLEAALPAAQGPNPVQALAFGRDALVPLDGGLMEPKWLLAVGDSGTGIVVWELGTQRPRSFCRGSTWEVQSVAFSPDGVTLASAGRLGVHFWDVATGQLLLWADRNGSRTRALAFNADGSRLVAGSTDEKSPGEISLWGLEPDRGIQRLRGLTTPIRKVRFSPDGGRIAAISDEWRLGVWDVPGGRLLRIFQLAAGIYADSASCAFGSDHRRIAVASGTFARTYDLETGRTLTTWDLPDGRRNSLEFSSDGRLFLARVESDSGPDPIRRWKVYELPVGQPALVRCSQPGSNDTTINVTLAPGDVRLVVLGKDTQSRSNHIAVIDLVSGRERWRRATGNSKNWENLRVDPMGTRCSTKWGPMDPVVEVPKMAILNLDDGKEEGILGDCWALGPMGHEYVVSKAQILQREGPKGEAAPPAILLASDGKIITDTHSFSPDGKRMAYGVEESAVFVVNLSDVRNRVATLYGRAGREEAAVRKSSMVH